ncbi:MAG: YfiR family protein [Cycloclasticus sp.]|nr:YfiR family protein [Cycloclasticus sp.]
MAAIPYPVSATDILTLKVALAYNLAKFVTWPEQAKANEFFQFCYLSKAYESGIEYLQGKKLHNKVIQKKYLKDLNQASVCDAIHISGANRVLLPRLLIALNKSPTLTVSDSAGFIDNGGMLEIVSKDNRLQFKANRTAFEKAGLSIRSKALKLALEVK